MRTITACFIALSCSLSMGCKQSGGTKVAPKTPAMSAFTTNPQATKRAPALQEQLQAALQAKGKDYVPRAEHKESGGQPKYLNRLILQTSPYLLQHAHNPVDWHAWGEEAFALAKKLGRPILLSVGYATCHWCHVMEHESFEDEEIAAYINANYIAIKVDREERPDVDGVYMTVVQLVTGRGGWPMTVVMTPDAKPFFGGTYFPARDGDRGARVGFFSLLKKLKTSYDKEPDKVALSAERLTTALSESQARPVGKTLPGDAVIARTAEMLARRFDALHGGFGPPPKFPRPSTYELLMHHWRRSQDEGALRMVTQSLDAMIYGGIYDHVGGGFHRYSTDRRWLVPHFEKMLYDNAQLVSLLVDVFQATGEAHYERFARHTLDYVLREMTSPLGAFYSATDADSEGVEGKFFVWSKSEIETALTTDEARAVIGYYGVREAGNFEHHNIFEVTSPADEVAKRIGQPLETMQSHLQSAREKLYTIRAKRIPPLLDDKLIVEWNGQMIGAMAKAAFVFEEPRYLAAAQKSADFILSTMLKDGRLKRTYRAGEARHTGVLEDYAFLIAGLLDLYQADAQPKWMAAAITLQKTLDARFWDDSSGGYFSTADDAEKLLVREKAVYDGAQPSGNSVTAVNLLRLASFTTKAEYRERAQRTLLSFAPALADGATECPKLALALDWYLDRAKEVAVVGGDDAAKAELMAVLRKNYVPNAVISVLDESDIDQHKAQVPWLEGKRAAKGVSTAYVCFEQVCKRPTSSGAEFEKQLLDVAPLKASKINLPK